MFSYWPSMPAQFKYFMFMVCAIFVGVVVMWIANLVKLRKSGGKATTTNSQANSHAMAASDVAHQQATLAHQQATLAHQQAVQIQQAEVNRQIIQGTINAAQSPPSSPPV